jgi:hypothetical protein
MAEPLFSDVFGVGASILNAGTHTPSKGLFIPEAAFSNVGLPNFTTATAEQILVAIMLIAKNSLTEQNRATDLTNRSVTVTYSGQDLVDQSPSFFRRDIFSVLLYKTTTLATVNPTDY